MQRLEVPQFDGSEIAVIGMACRFPKSNDIERFWENLRNGVNCISTLTDEELEPSGIDPVALNHPDYVKAAPILDDVELFDAAFFSITPNEALVMDPQHRLFLQCAWSALEDAGYNPETCERAIGVFAGARTSSYLFNIYSNPEVVNATGGFEIGLGNDLGFLSTRTSYKLNLRGPSYSVHTACSTSLVAVHLACQNLLIDECQMALAGGVAVNIPHKTGYLYRPGSLFSPDGHCRPFDERAQGTVFGSGVGIIVLKRLEDALRDHDHIYALIRGSATNNDGSAKASFSAPGIQGQSRVILDALAAAGAAPESISYVEAHGTGTPIGDPIEIRALTQAFRTGNVRKHSCAIGSVKSNLGHLDAAAGMASIIKTILSLHNKALPPTINFTTPNREMGLEESPFYVNAELQEWKSEGRPRRAGVSSFGVGGTNAHVVLEEAPEVKRQERVGRGWELLVLSARSETALERMSRNLGEYLKKHGSEVELGDVAYTLQVGRKIFPYRRFTLCGKAEEGAEALLGENREKIYTEQQERQKRPVVFLFPGQGSQYAGMGRGLWEEESVFRAEVDRCAEYLKEEIGVDLREVLYGSEVTEGGKQLQQTWLTQPALFVVEYALARQWMSWGVKPGAMLGHSVGEYVAACVAGVFSVEEGLRLVARRGRLMQKVGAGKMLAVGIGESEGEGLKREGVWLAAVNGPMQVVMCGKEEGLKGVEKELAEEGVSCRWLETSHAFHSGMMEAVLEEFEEEVRRVKLKEPEVPFISNVTGKWIRAEEARDPGYWVRHMRETVRFGDGMKELLQDPQRVFLEVGPGQTLNALAKSNAGPLSTPVVLPSLRSTSAGKSDSQFLGTILGRLWLSGAKVDDQQFYASHLRRRLPLPTYSFEGEHYWLTPKTETFSVTANRGPSGKNPQIENWFFFPMWKRSLPANLEQSAAFTGPWVIFTDSSELASAVVDMLRQQAKTVFAVEAGAGFSRKNEHHFVINPREWGDYDLLLREISAASAVRIIHFWSISGAIEEPSGPELFKSIQVSGYYSLLFLSQALAIYGQEAQVNVVSDNLYSVETSDSFLPEKQPMATLCKIIPQENPAIEFHCMDIGSEKTASEPKNAATLILEEANSAPGHMLVAYRRGQRFIQVFDPIKLTRTCRRLRPLKEKGVYVITGAFGGVGTILSEHLAKKFHSRLVLISRSQLPEATEWPDYLKNHSPEDEISRRIMHVQRLQELGAEVMAGCVNVGDPIQLNSYLDLVQGRYGEIDGVFHAAGITTGESVYRSFTEIGPVQSEIQFEPKVYGVYALRDALEKRDVKFCMMFSSIASVLGGLGYLTYAAANSFMDSFSAALSQGNTAWFSVNWDPWPEETKKSTIQTDVDQYAMTKEESLDALERILEFCVPGQIVVATGDLDKRLNIWMRRTSDSPAGLSSKRPTLHTKYVAPSGELEEKITRLWERLLGIDGIGVHDNFFDLGGHSLLATRLISQLRDEIGVVVPINEFFASPTIVGIAERAGGMQNGEQDDERDAILNLLEQLSEEEVGLELKKRSAVQG